MVFPLPESIGERMQARGSKRRTGTMRTPAYLYFSLDEYQARLDGLRERMQRRGVAALVVTTPENIYYLSGYQTPGYYWSMALVVFRDHEPVLIPPPHEESLVPAFCVFERYQTYRDTADWIGVTSDVVRAARAGKARIGYEASSWFLRIGEFERLRSALPEAELVDGSGLVEAGRLIKSAAEIGYIRDAARASQAGMNAGVEATGAGATENEIASAVVAAQLAHGSEYSGLPPFINSGPRTMLVHVTWSGRRVEANEPVFLEIPGCIHRYHAAMTRTVWTGTAPDLLGRANETNTDALRMAKAAIRPGVKARTVFEIARDRIAAGDVGYRQGRRVAYGIGIGFPPRWDEGHIMSINDGEERTLSAGMTFHLITTMRIRGLGAVGCSDTVLVTETGCETLTSAIEPGVILKS